MLNKIKSILGLKPKADLAELIQNGAVIVDVRSKGEYASGHFNGSLNIPLDVLSGNFNKIKDKNSVIITCCASGIRSASAKSILRNAGYTNVHNGGSWTNVEKKAHQKS